VYNASTGEGFQWRVPDVPFISESFCMADHGIFAEAVAQPFPSSRSPSDQQPLGQPAVTHYPSTSCSAPAA
jgi:hypothetical protein